MVDLGQRHPRLVLWGEPLETFEGRQRKLAGLAKARARSLESRRSASPLTAVNRVLRGPKKLRPKHLDIARRVVLGQPNTQIARELGLCQDIVNVIVRSPIFQEEVSRLKTKVETHFVSQSAADPVRKLAQEQGLPSIQALMRLRDGALKEDVQFKASMGLLEVGGFRKQEESVSQSAPLSGDVAEAIRIGLREVQAYIEVKRGRVTVPPSGSTPA